MWIAELGLYYYKARFYNPETGRFMQTDPIGLSGGLNLYAYTGNDPVNASDPSGLTPPTTEGEELVVTGNRPKGFMPGGITSGCPSGYAFINGNCYDLSILFPAPSIGNSSGGGGSGGGGGSQSDNTTEKPKKPDMPQCPAPPIYPIPKGYVTADPGRNRYIMREGAKPGSAGAIELNPAYSEDVKTQKVNVPGVIIDLAGIAFGGLTGSVLSGGLTVGTAALAGFGVGLSGAQELVHSDGCSY